MARNTPDSPQPNEAAKPAKPVKKEEARWTDEGGSNQHFSHTDEPADKPAESNSKPGRPDGTTDEGMDRMWKADKNQKRKNVPH